MTAIQDLSASLFYKKLRGDDEEVPENRAPENRAPENRTPENRAPENRCPENRAFSNTPSYGKLIEVAKEINFTALGVLAVLIEAFPTGYGHLSILQFALACGVSRSALVTQLRILEQKGLVKLGRPKQVGRDIEIVFVTQGK